MKTLRLACLLAAATAVAYVAKAADPTVPPAATSAPNPAALRRHPTAYRGAGRALDERVRIITRRLQLDAGQQAEVRKVLERQRELVNQVWADHTMSGADHVGATRAIAERTADQIRAMLNPEQRRRFGEASPLRDKPQASEADVEHWMQVTRAGGRPDPGARERKPNADGRVPRAWDGPAPNPGGAQANRDDHVGGQP